MASADGAGDDGFPVKKPSEMAIVFDPDNGRVFFSDFPPPSQDRQNASDILDPEKDQDLHRVISVALSRVGQIVESECRFRNRISHVRVKVEEFSPDSGPTSTGRLKEVAWSRRVQVFIQYE